MYISMNILHKLHKMNKNQQKKNGAFHLLRSLFVVFR